MERQQRQPQAGGWSRGRGRGSGSTADRGSRGGSARGGNRGRGRGRGGSNRGPSHGDELAPQDVPLLEAPYALVDIGANLGHRSFENDFEAILERSQQTNVKAIIITGTSERSSSQAFKLAQKRPGFMYSTAGVHPHDAKSCNDKTIARLRELALNREVVAIGECGLDFDRNFSLPAVQEQWFAAQLELAKEVKKPLFLHERSAFKSFVEIIKEHSEGLPPCVVHCFTGEEHELKQYLEMGMYIGWICDERRGRLLQKIVSKVPLDKLMIETDAPFLTPRTIQPTPRRNEPAYLPYVLEKIAECTGRTVKEVAQETTNTAIKFFGLDPIE